MCLASSTHSAKLESRCWDLRSCFPSKQDKSPSPVQMCHGSSSLCTEAAMFWVPSSETPTGNLCYFSISKRLRNRRQRSTYLIITPPVKHLKQASYKHAKGRLLITFTANWAESWRRRWRGKRTWDLRNAVCFSESTTCFANGNTAST